MRHGSLFSSIGGFDLAAKWVGWENKFYCEIDEFCRRVLDYHFPNSKGYTDVKKTNFNEWKGQIDVISGGFPCFVAGTQVNTTNGLRPIEDLTLDDKVLTKEGRYMPINALMRKNNARDDCQRGACERHGFYRHLSLQSASVTIKEDRR